MNSPARPNYALEPFDPVKRRGIVEALKLGTKQTLEPPIDGNEDYTQRDINEMIDRGWAMRFRQRPADKAWRYVLTRQGYQMGVDLSWVGEE